MKWAWTREDVIAGISTHIKFVSLLHVKKYLTVADCTKHDSNSDATKNGI